MNGQKIRAALPCGTDGVEKPQAFAEPLCDDGKRRRDARAISFPDYGRLRVLPAMLKRQRSIIGARPSADAHAVVATRADVFPGGHARCFLWSFIRHKLRAARPFIVVLAARGKAPSGCGTKKQKALIAFAVSTITSTALRPCIRDRRSLLPRRAVAAAPAMLPQHQPPWWQPVSSKAASRAKTRNRRVRVDMSMTPYEKIRLCA